MHYVFKTRVARFKAWACQVEHTVASSSPLLRHFLRSQVNERFDLIFTMILNKFSILVLFGKWYTDVATIIS